MTALGSSVGHCGRVLVLLGFALAASNSWSGNRLYRWVDQSGQVHFSDAPPNGFVGPVEAHPLPAPAASAFPQGGGDYSVLNQVKQLERERLQREEARRQLEMRRLEMERRQAELDAANARARQAEFEADRAVSGPYLYPGDPPWPHDHHRPHRPRDGKRGGWTPVKPAKPDPSFLSSPERILTRPDRSLAPVTPAR